jgi:hypothetical protein
MIQQPGTNGFETPGKKLDISNINDPEVIALTARLKKLCGNDCFTYTTDGSFIFFKQEFSGDMKVVFHKDGTATVYTSGFILNKPDRNDPKSQKQIQEVKFRFHLYTNNGTYYSNYQWEVLGLGANTDKVGMETILEKFSAGKQNRLAVRLVFDDESKKSEYWRDYADEYEGDYLDRARTWTTGGFKAGQEPEDLLVDIAKPR